jgi:hypothetical protein
VIVEIEAVILSSGEHDVIDDFGTDSQEVMEKKPGESHVLRYLNEKESSEIVKAVSRVTERYQSRDFQINLSGGPVVGHVFNPATLKDTALCMAIAPLPVLLFPFSPILLF